MYALTAHVRIRRRGSGEFSGAAGFIWLGVRRGAFIPVIYLKFSVFFLILVFIRHFHNPDVIPAQAGIQDPSNDWIPACAGMTKRWAKIMVEGEGVTMVIAGIGLSKR